MPDRYGLPLKQTPYQKLNQLSIILENDCGNPLSFVANSPSYGWWDTFLSDLAGVLQKVNRGGFGTVWLRNLHCFGPEEQVADFVKVLSDHKRSISPFCMKPRDL